MEAHGEPAADEFAPERPSFLGRRQCVLAAQIIAVGRKIEPAPMDEAERAEIAVVAGIDPDGAVFLLAPADQRPRAPSEEAAVTAVLEDFGRVGVLDAERRMGGGGAHALAPRAVQAGGAAAVADQALLAQAHLEAQRSGVGMALGAGRRRRADVGDDERTVVGQAFEARVRRRGQRLARGVGVGQDHVDQPGLFLVAVIEQGDGAVAVAEEPHHRRHAVDRRLQGRGNVPVGGDQGGADIDEVAQDRELQGRAAFEVSAVAQHLAHQLLFQQP